MNAAAHISTCANAWATKLHLLLTDCATMSNQDTTQACRHPPCSMPGANHLQILLDHINDGLRDGMCMPKLDSIQLALMKAIIIKLSPDEAMSADS